MRMHMRMHMHMHMHVHMVTCTCTQVGFATTAPYRPWFVNFSAATASTLQKKDLLFGPSLSYQNGGAQYGGEIVDYEGMHICACTYAHMRICTYAHAHMYTHTGAQYGGEIVDYDHGLSFATVHGSGHMVREGARGGEGTWWCASTW